MLELTQPFYDSDLSIIKYENWKNVLSSNDSLCITRPNPCNQSLVYVIIGDDDLSTSYYTTTRLRSMKKAVLLDLYFDLVDDGLSELATKKELIDALMNVTIAQFYEHKAKAELFNKLDCDFTLYGNNQSEVVKVKIISERLKWNTEDYLQKLFFDVPITAYAQLENGNTIYLSNLLDTEYLWDKNQIIDRLTKEREAHGVSQTEIEYIENNLLDEPRP